MPTLNGMNREQLALSAEILAVMRGAVTHARAAGRDFVSPGHVLLALLDDATLGAALGGLIARDTLVADAKRVKLPGVLEIPEGQLPDGEKVPFKRYDTLAFRSPDGAGVMWLDRDAFKVFIEGAHRVDAGAYKPKHLVLGFAAESFKDGVLRDLIGRDPAALTDAVAGLA